MATVRFTERLTGGRAAAGRAGCLVDLGMISRLAASSTLFSEYSNDQSEGLGDLFSWNL